MSRPEVFIDSDLQKRAVAEHERWTRVKPLIEDIALQAAYMPEFEQAVASSANLIDARFKVEALLAEHFPQVAKLERAAVAGVADNSFYVAKEIILMLRKPGPALKTKS